ncbi:MAG: multidrug ABC transporter substrate-binding protein [Planctomycetota bacterium]|nr:MAG: multidrug ABC transporter substrate-binding protein [Planctomycetota bacterium]
MLALWIECLKMGLKELWRHRLRSMLTMIGMIMGVSAVIICVTVVQGVKESLIGDIRRAGRNMIFVITDEGERTRASAAEGAASNLTRADAEAIEMECDAVAMSCATHGVKTGVVSETEGAVVDINGVEHTYTAIRNWGVSEGRDLEPFDIVAPRRVCLVGVTAAQALFGDRNPINEVVRVGRTSFKIVGLLESKGVNPLGQDEDNVLIVPLPILLRDILAVREPPVILCSATSDETVERAVTQIRDLLRQRHGISESEKDDFKVTTLKEKEEQARRVGDEMTLLMFFLALVSLAVGGVGIMNIMLVAVTERTREIGIRMAIGASTKAINRQFLIEASVISSAGGAVGIVLGIVFAVMIADAIGIQAELSTWIIVLAFVFSAGVGVVFGLWPARRAAGLNPIEALRHD